MKMTPYPAYLERRAVWGAILFLLLPLFSRSYEAVDSVLGEENLSIRANPLGELCCSCRSHRRGARQNFRGEDCCPCPLESASNKIPLESTPNKIPLESTPNKIPLVPLPRGLSAFANAVVDGAVQSCVLITGDILSSRPSCVSYTEGRIDCFYVNAEKQTVHQKTILDGEPLESVDLRGKVRDEVVAMAVSRNKFMLVALNQSNHLVSRTIRKGRWTEWTAVSDAVALEVPTAFMRRDGGVTCFYRCPDNLLWYVDYSRYGVWSQPKKLDINSMVAAPTCVTRGQDDAEECFVLDADNAVAHQHWFFGDWHLQKGLDGFGKERISVTSLGMDRLDIFVLGRNNQLMHRALVEEEWEEWEDLGGSFVSAPECVAMVDNTLHCFLIGADRTLMHRSFDGNSWLEWASSAQALIEKPSCVVTSSMTIACYSRGYTGHMVEVVYRV